MKLHSIFVSGFLGVAQADMRLHQPVNLFAGRNGAGKSSLRDAIALALTADLGRVSLKKEAPALIRDGAEAAVCEVVDSDGDEFRVSINRAGKITDSRSGKGEPDQVLPYVLDAQRLARLGDTERRAFLFGLMGVKTDPATVKERLTVRGCDATRVERIAPMLRAGFDAAAKDAKAKATEAKGAWRTVTGEAFGSEKAKNWRASVPAYDAKAAAALTTELQHCDVALDQWQQQVGRLQAEETRRAGLRAKLPALQEHAAKIAGIEKKLAIDAQQLADWQTDLEKTKAAAGVAPRSGLVHDLASALRDTLFFVGKDHQFRQAWEKPLTAYEAEHGSLDAKTGGDEKARTRLPSVQKSRDLMASAVEHDKRDLSAAQRAKAEADTITAELAEVFDAAGLADARAKVDEIKSRRAELVKQSDALSTVKKLADAAERKTTEAGKHAADVAAWDAIGDALAPDGIPGEILSEALGPMNERLAQAAADTGWPQVVVGADMAITAAGREYRLLSESEKWRVDAMLAEAVSHLSGAALLVLDRFDVLDLPGRSELLGWLDVLAETGEVATALIFGALKALPSGLPATTAAHWIENGVVGQLKEAA